MKAKRATVSQMMAATCRALRLGREFPDRPFRVYANTERDALRVADALKAAGMISDEAWYAATDRWRSTGRWYCEVRGRNGKWPCECCGGDEAALEHGGYLIVDVG